MSGSRVRGAAGIGLIFDIDRPAPTVTAKLYFYLLKEVCHEYRDLALTGPGHRNLDFAGAQVFKLFRGRVFDPRGYRGTHAPKSYVRRYPKNLSTPF